MWFEKPSSVWFKSIVRRSRISQTLFKHNYTQQNTLKLHFTSILLWSEKVLEIRLGPVDPSSIFLNVISNYTCTTVCNKKGTKWSLYLKIILSTSWNHASFFNIQILKNYAQLNQMTTVSTQDLFELGGNVLKFPSACPLPRYVRYSPSSDGSSNIIWNKTNIVSVETASVQSYLMTCRQMSVQFTLTFQNFPRK